MEDISNIVIECNDRCILCNNYTPYTLNYPINNRLFYINTIGQLCGNCYMNTQYNYYKKDHSAYCVIM